MSNWKDKTGQRFGRLVVLNRDEKDRSGQPRWRCRCDCGNETVVYGSGLVTGHTSSCGCYGAEARRTHGHSLVGAVSRTYSCWRSMRARIFNKDSDSYKDYGGRGISICDRWMKFENFLEDMGEAPKGLSIERLNNDGDYCKENCRWATYTKQNRNSRNVKLSMEAAREIRKDPRTIWAIAKDYGVCESNIARIRANKIWKENQPLFYEPQPQQPQPQQPEEPQWPSTPLPSTTSVTVSP